MPFPGPLSLPFISPQVKLRAPQHLPLLCFIKAPSTVTCLSHWLHGRHSSKHLTCVASLNPATGLVGELEVWMRPGQWAPGPEPLPCTALAWPHAAAVLFPATSHAGPGNRSSLLPAHSAQTPVVLASPLHWSFFQTGAVTEMQMFLFYFISVHFTAYILIAISPSPLKLEIFPLSYTEMIRVFQRASQNWVNKSEEPKLWIANASRVSPSAFYSQIHSLGEGFLLVLRYVDLSCQGLYTLDVYRNTGEDMIRGQAVCLALGFQKHLELSGHFLRANESSLYIKCQEPQEDRAIGSNTSELGVKANL